jgi:hypothetical protein
MTSNDMDFLGRLAEATTGACRVEPGMEAAPGTVNQLPFPAVLPGSRGCYPAVWIQDFTMIFSAGFLANEVGLIHLRLMLGCQNSAAPRKLTSGAWIPPYAIPDHILLDGRPVFFALKRRKSSSTVCTTTCTVISSCRKDGANMTGKERMLKALRFEELAEAGAEFVHVVNDVAFNAGPFISPSQFSTFITPHL